MASTTSGFRKHTQGFFHAFNQKLEPSVKQHLTQVYSTLAGATLAAGVGSYINLFTGFGDFLAIIGSIGLLIMLTITPDTGKNRSTRLQYLLGFAGCTGMSMGPLISTAIYLNPKIVPFALMSTFLIFASFTMSAIFANHKNWLYIGGGLMSMLSIMFVTSLVNLFIGSYILFKAQLYLGLFVFCLFIMYDTAQIIERKRMGESDYIKHAMFLFTDLVDIFRTLVILMTQKERDSRNRRK